MIIAQVAAARVCRCSSEVMQILWRELGMSANGELTAASWEKFMVQVRASSHHRCV